MNLKQITLAATAGLTLLAAAPVFAQSHWNQGHGWRAPQRHHHYHRPPVYVYAPPPVVYYAPPAPYYYAPPPRPVIYGSIPFGDTRVRIGLQF